MGWHQCSLYAQINSHIGVLLVHSSAVYQPPPYKISIFPLLNWWKKDFNLIVVIRILEWPAVVVRTQVVQQPILIVIVLVIEFYSVATVLLNLGNFFFLRGCLGKVLVLGGGFKLLIRFVSEAPFPPSTALLFHLLWILLFIFCFSRL